VTELRGLPAYMDRGQMVELAGDVLRIVERVKEISPRLRIYYNEQTDEFDLTEVSLDGGIERLVFSVEELDARVISRLQVADQWQGREEPTHVLPDDEDFLSKIDADEALERAAIEARSKEKLHDAGERLAWSLGEDRRGVQASILVPRGVNGSPNDS
jgi:hypothetical protein